MTSIALADSINPSTIIPALWLASAPSEVRLASYALGVFVVYLAGGIVLLLGPGPALISFLRHLRGPVEHSVEVIAGMLALTVAVALWRSRSSATDQSRVRRPQTRASAFTLGAGIMAIELPTAFMYFGAISAILAAHRATPIEISLLIAYNALFVAPLVVLLVAARLAGPRTDRWISSASARLRYVGQLVLAGVAGTAGAALLTIGLVGLVIV
ncbi:MAG: GAP family protein [Solirubrobacterales bacterium]|nr:GAP family protein [Solirubrobacterales bacterium]